jgi:hypothetical protein
MILLDNCGEHNVSLVARESQSAQEGSDVELGNRAQYVKRIDFCYASLEEPWWPWKAT